jgi:hypothetical protein
MPAGAYELDVSTSRPRAGELLVYVRDSLIQRLQLTAESSDLDLVLPEGAIGLVILADPSLQKIIGHVALRPVHVKARVRTERLRRTTHPET